MLLSCIWQENSSSCGNKSLRHFRIKTGLFSVWQEYQSDCLRTKEIYFDTQPRCVLIINIIYSNRIFLVIKVLRLTSSVWQLRILPMHNISSLRDSRHKRGLTKPKQLNRQR